MQKIAPLDFQSKQQIFTAVNTEIVSYSYQFYHDCGDHEVFKVTMLYRVQLHAYMYTVCVYSRYYIYMCFDYRRIR